MTNNILVDISTEKFLISSMLLKDGEIIPAVSKILQPYHFYRPEHRIIFQHLLLAFSKNGRADLLSLIDELRASGNLNKIGGVSTIFSLSEIANTTAYSISYAQRLKDKAHKRELLEVMEKISNGVESGELDTSDIYAVLNAISSRFVALNEESRIINLADYLDSDFSADITESQKYADRKTGFDNIDNFQIFNSGLYVLGATPACGKTTFAWQLAEQLANNGETCIFCSYEMSRLELFSKSLARNIFELNPFTPLTAADIRKGSNSNELSNVIADFKKRRPKLEVLELHNETIDDLLAILRAFVWGNSNHAPIIFIDYLQIIPSNIDNTKQAISDTVRKLKLFQRDTNSTFIVVSSFNRTNYSQAVSFESFKESGEIEYSADVVWALQLNVMNTFKQAASISKIRDDVRMAKKKQPRELELKCLKNRHGNDYDCYFFYHSAHDAFVPCEQSDFDTQGPPEKNDTPPSNSKGF